MKRTIFIAISLYILTLSLCLWTTLPGDNLQGDSIGELSRTRQTIVNGWNPLTTWDYNNSSAVPNFIAPVFSRIFEVDPKWIYKIMFPMIFALTPVLLFLLYRKLSGSRVELLAAIAFILIAPTYKEAPTIAKTAVAEPLAVLALLAFYSGLRYRLPLTALITVAVFLCHYTIGIFLIMWLGAISISDRKALMPLCVGTLAALVYFNFASGGIILRSVLLWNGTGLISGLYPQDPVLVALTGNDFVVVSLAARLARIATFLEILLIITGLLYFLHNKRVLESNMGFANCLIFASLLMPAVLLFPILTKPLFATRWIQASAVIFCPAIGYANKWIPTWVIVLILLIQFFFTSGIAAWAIHYPGIDMPTMGMLPH